jgi:heme/copper-type cytochrome/quinol oxidase subunit 2
MDEERQGDFVFTANEVGEYSFCFSNELSGLSSKLIDFDITVESEPRREASAKPGQLEEQTSALEESISRLSGLLNNIRRTQR